MKKVFITILSLIILCCGAISLTACDDDKVYKLTDIPYIEDLSYTDIDHIKLTGWVHEDMKAVQKEVTMDKTEDIQRIIGILAQMEFSHIKSDPIESYWFNIVIHYTDDTESSFSFIGEKLQCGDRDTYILSDIDLRNQLEDIFEAAL